MIAKSRLSPPAKQTPVLDIAARTRSQSIGRQTLGSQPIKPTLVATSIAKPVQICQPTKSPPFPEEIAALFFPMDVPATEILERIHETEQKALSVSRGKVAEMLGLSQRSVDRLIRSGHLTSTKPGRRVLVSLKSIKEFARNEPAKR